MKELDEQAEKVEKLEDVVDIIKKYAEILRTKRKGIINLFKLIEKHPKLMKSSVKLTFLKNYF